jgi:hypothetical protein
VAGRNSFTEGQAKSKIEEAGYTNVTALQKDDNGVWRGKASKGGASSDVSVYTTRRSPRAWPSLSAHPPSIQGVSCFVIETDRGGRLSLSS